MKTIRIIIAILLINGSFIGLLNAQTSLEEYNYVTKGYGIQLESGLDMKQGYEFEDLISKKTTFRTADSKILYRLSETGEREIAAYLIIYNKISSNTGKEYICIPHPDSDEEILTRYWNQLYDKKTPSSDRLQLILFTLSQSLVW